MSVSVLLAGVLALTNAVPAPLWAQVAEAGPAAESAPAPATVSPELAARRESEARLQEAYAAGMDVGIGAPLVAVGAPVTFIGLLALVAVGGDQSEIADSMRLLVTGVDAAQLVPGALLIHGGRNNEARHAVASGRAAYDAGFETGLGRTLVAYGLLTLIRYAVAYAGDGVESPTFGAVLVGGQLATGGWAWYVGTRDFERLRAQPVAPPQGDRGRPMPRLLPVVHVSF
jgi:hypothetical protein